MLSVPYYLACAVVMILTFATCYVTWELWRLLVAYLICLRYQLTYQYAVYKLRSAIDAASRLQMELYYHELDYTTTDITDGITYAQNSLAALPKEIPVEYLSAREKYTSGSIRRRYPDDGERSCETVEGGRYNRQAVD